MRNMGPRGARWATKMNLAHHMILFALLLHFLDSIFLNPLFLLVNGV
jgi:hypothetical protein